MLVISILISGLAADKVAAQRGDAYPSYRLTGFMEQNITYEQDANPELAFSVHRARVGFAGRVNELVSIQMVAGVLEPPDRSPQLVNGFVDLDIHPMLRLRAGQFLVPFGLEGPEPVFRNPAVERSTVIRRMNYFRMFGDVGIMASGSQDKLTYAIALVNGTGANVTERINPKDLLGRVGYQLRDDLDLGASFHTGTSPVPEMEPSRFRLGVDATWRSDPLLVRGEYILRRDESVGGSDRTQHGGYVLAGYHFNEELQGILRLEMHRPNTDAKFGDSGLTILGAGLNYYLQGQNRVALNYEVRTDRHDGVDLGNLLTIQLQIVF